MDQGLMQLGIAAACGVLVALLFARGWLAAAVLGFLAALPFAIFSVYMVSGGNDGAGFDSSKLPEGSVSMLNFATWFSIPFGLSGLVGGLIAFGLKRVICR